MHEPSSSELRRIRQLLTWILFCVIVIALVLVITFAPKLIEWAVIGVMVLFVCALPFLLPMIWDARKEYIEYRRSGWGK